MDHGEKQRHPKKLRAAARSAPRRSSAAPRRSWRAPSVRRVAAEAAAPGKTNGTNVAGGLDWTKKTNGPSRINQPKTKETKNQTKQNQTNSQQDEDEDEDAWQNKARLYIDALVPCPVCSSIAETFIRVLLTFSSPGHPIKVGTAFVSWNAAVSIFRSLKKKKHAIFYSKYQMATAIRLHQSLLRKHEVVGPNFQTAQAASQFQLRPQRTQWLVSQLLSWRRPPLDALPSLLAHCGLSTAKMAQGLSKKAYDFLG